MKLTHLLLNVLITGSLMSAGSAATAMTMQELFDGTGAEGNVSTAAVVQGQTMNVYTGGSMFMRAPKRTYNVATFTPPSYSAGCGGIDIFSGGFSFINKEQFVAMLRNIGSNALGYGFKLAVQNLCPTCDNVMQALQATAQAMNRQNIDSCEAAKGFINASIPDTWSRDKTNSAKNYGVDSNLFSDITDAWTNVMNDERRTNETMRTVAASKPEIQDALPAGNVTWNALKKIDGLTNDYRMLIMSMIGTTVFQIVDEVNTPQVYQAKGITVQDLIGGNVVRDDNGAPRGLVELPIWRCLDTDKCLTMVSDTAKGDSFKVMISRKLDEVTSKISSRQPYADPEGVLRFLNTTDMPVYKMIAITATLNNTAMADSMLNRYQELLAAKYAEVYIRQATGDLRLALNNFSSAASPTVSAVLVTLKPELDRLDANAREVLVTAYTQTISTYNIAQEVGHMERALNANLSQTLKASLAFGKSVR